MLRSGGVHAFGRGAVLSAALALAACGSSAPSHSGDSAAGSSTSGSVTATTGSGDPAGRSGATTSTGAAGQAASIVAVLHAPGHTPKVGNWPITIDLTRNGHPIHGHISYAFLFGGQVVSTQPVGTHSPDFVGVFHDIITWPARSAGLPLTFRVVITTPYGVKDVDYPVKVSP